jgi:hypothetical protein
MTQDIKGFKPVFVTDDDITSMVLSGNNVLVSAGKYIYQLPLAFFDTTKLDPETSPDRTESGAGVVIVTPDRIDALEVPSSVPPVREHNTLVTAEEIFAP